MLWKPIIVADGQRAVVTRAGRFHQILGPGEHRLFTGPLRPVEIETHSVRGLVFNSFWTDFLVNRHPEVVARHFFPVETSDSQIAMIYADGSLFNVLLPAKRLLFWRGVAEIAIELVDVIDRPEGQGTTGRGRPRDDRIMKRCRSPVRGSDHQSKKLSARRFRASSEKLTQSAMLSFLHDAGQEAPNRFEGAEPIPATTASMSAGTLMIASSRSNTA